MDGKRLALGRNAVRPAVDCFDKPPPIVINTARRQGGHELNGRRYSSILARCRWGGGGNELGSTQIFSRMLCKRLVHQEINRKRVSVSPSFRGPGKSARALRLFQERKWRCSLVSCVDDCARSGPTSKLCASVRFRPVSLGLLDVPFQHNPAFVVAELN